MRDITLCHPQLQELAAKWIKKCSDNGIQVKIGETFRTVAEQDALYAQGRTTPGPVVTNAPGKSYSSQHQWGIAFDFYLSMDVDGDGKISDDSFNDSTGLFEKAAGFAKELGLSWGGDWKSIVDKPHLYLPDWGSTTTKLKQLFGTPDKFEKTWKQPVGWIQDATGWWYRHEDGSYTANEWEKIDGKWYWFNGAGYAVQNDWYQYHDKWYYLGDDGAMVTGLQIIRDKAYYFHEDGAMAGAGEKVTLAPDETGALH